jgi:hypothetical protein
MNYNTDDTRTSRVGRLTNDAHTAARDILALFDQITPAETGIVTEIGWSVAATLAHLAGSYAPSLTRSVIERSRAGKSLNIPDWIIHLTNWIGKMQTRRKPASESRAQFERDLRAALERIADVSDADLDCRITVPIIGEVTLEDYLRYVFVGHLHEHGDQIRRALEPRAVASR